MCWFSAPVPPFCALLCTTGGRMSANYIFQTPFGQISNKLLTVKGNDKRLDVGRKGRPIFSAGIFAPGSAFGVNAGLGSCWGSTVLTAANPPSTGSRSLQCQGEWAPGFQQAALAVGGTPASAAAQPLGLGVTPFPFCVFIPGSGAASCSY